MNRLLSLTVLAAITLQTGCRPGAKSGRSASHSNNQSSPASQSSTARAMDACSLVLAPHSGKSRTDKEIIRLQKAIPGARDSAALLERLGWMYVAKGRESFDPGFYKLAEQCTVCLETRKPGAFEILLLRGHILQNLHRFKEAEPIARKLAAERGLPFDFGLLGDVLMERGQLDGAIDAYQKMVDLKPDAPAYARIAHLRWLKGDLKGALEVMRLAASATSPHAPESAAWIHSRLALYELQAGDRAAAIDSCRVAFEFQADYPPASLALGRIHLAAGQAAEAVEPLLRAARLNPLPEYQWTLAEALHAAGKADEARKVEVDLNKTGASNDPRTFALFLATRGAATNTALELAAQELKERADVHTYDALAWAMASAGRWEEARVHSKKALAEGTDDARIRLHAGIIAARVGAIEEASRLLELASSRQQMLLPSEREQLHSVLQRRAGAAARQTASTSGSLIP
jgi:tetratricopeptide (TPR) repeat protein